MISKFDHRKLALSMATTNIRKNRYCSISLLLKLVQNILTTITSWQPLVFILCLRFLSISADAFHIFSLRFETFITRGLCFTFCVSKGGIHTRMSFLLLLLLFPTTQGFFLPKFLARIRRWKPSLTFVCGYQRVLGSLQAARSTRYLAIIETPAAVVFQHNFDIFTFV